MIALTDLYPTLTNIVRNLERDDVATVEALLIDVTGDVDAGRMLNRLAMWWGKTRNPDGWVYKSHEDWWAELRIKEHKLPRTKGHLERVGVTIKVMKAVGSPTRHYCLNVKTFMQMVAAALKVSRKKLLLLLQFPSESSARKEVGNGQKTITTESTPQSSPDVVVNTAILEAKKIKGISDHTARRLVAQYGSDRIIAITSLAQQKSRKNPAGWFIQALKENWQFQPVDGPTPLPPSPSDPAKWESDQALDDDTTPDFEAEIAAGGDTQPVIVPPDLRAFGQAMQQLKLQYGKQGDYLMQIHLARADGNCWFVQAQGYAMRLLQDHRLRNDIAKIGRVLTGESSLTVEVEAGDELAGQGGV